VCADLLIRNGRVVDPSTGVDGDLDVRIRDAEVVEIGSRLSRADSEAVFDADGCVVAPGLIDLHVHLRDPGESEKETIVTGTRAAAAGGFVGVACMANTSPTLDTPELIRYAVRQAETAGYADVYPIASISKGLVGDEPCAYDVLSAAGACGFSDDGKSTMDEGIMRAALESSRSTKRPVLVHCEDPEMAGDGVMHDGDVAAELGLLGLPGRAEERIVARDLRLAEETGGRLHILHVTTRGGIELIAAAKKRGVDVTAEACPHHFTLTHEAVREHGTAAKMNPPLRTSDDVAAIVSGLADGTLDVIATDHAPHTAEEKRLGMKRAPFGIIGSELCVPLTWSRLVSTGTLTVSEALAKLTVAPSRVLARQTPSIAVGRVASLTIIDPELRLEVTRERLVSKSANTPFLGEHLTGWPLLTLRNGRETFLRNEAAARYVELGRST